jgi:hypothetical protein
MAMSNTFFEQIPIETVKRITKEFPEENANGGNGEKTEMPDELRSPRERWHEVAQKTQHKRDPKKVTEPIEQLIALLDQGKVSKREGCKRNPGNGSAEGDGSARQTHELRVRILQSGRSETLPESGKAVCDDSLGAVLVHVARDAQTSAKRVH